VKFESTFEEHTSRLSVEESSIHATKTILIEHREETNYVFQQNSNHHKAFIIATATSIQSEAKTTRTKEETPQR
jgi:hypothetical protein